MVTLMINLHDIFQYYITLLQSIVLLLLLMILGFSIRF